MLGSHRVAAAVARAALVRAWLLAADRDLTVTVRAGLLTVTVVLLAPAHPVRLAITMPAAIILRTPVLLPAPSPSRR